MNVIGTTYLEKRLDGYLSSKAQLIDPSSLVYCEYWGDGPGSAFERWVLVRVGHEILGLGQNFGSAKIAIEALVRARQAYKKDPGCTTTL